MRGGQTSAWLCCVARWFELRLRRAAVVSAAESTAVQQSGKKDKIKDNLLRRAGGDTRFEQNARMRRICRDSWPDLAKINVKHLQVQIKVEPPRRTARARNGPRRSMSSNMCLAQQKCRNFHVDRPPHQACGTHAAQAS